MNKSEVVNWEELILSNMIQLEAITNILIREGVTSKEDLLEEVKTVRDNIETLAKKMQKSN